MKTRNKRWVFWLACVGLGQGAAWYFWPTPVPAWPKETATLARLTQYYGARDLPRQHWVVFVSVGGCGYCMGHLLRFIEQHKGEPRYVFIIPSRSRKDYTLDIPPHVRFQKNVFRDSLEISYRDSLLKRAENTAYRVVAGEIVEKVVLTPENVTDRLAYLESMSGQ